VLAEVGRNNLRQAQVHRLLNNTTYAPHLLPGRLCSSHLGLQLGRKLLGRVILGSELVDVWMQQVSWYVYISDKNGQNIAVALLHSRHHGCRELVHRDRLSRYSLEMKGTKYRVCEPYTLRCSRTKFFPHHSLFM
jgi:hypothetical protein